MSLFQKRGFTWRETYQIFFRVEDRPTGDRVAQALAALGDRFQVSDMAVDSAGQLENLSMDILGEDMAMDVVFIEGEEIQEQLPGILRELRRGMDQRLALSDIDRVASATGRFDVLHFQKQVEDEEETDPGSLFVVLNALARLCHGVAIDPQSACFISDE